MGEKNGDAKTFWMELEDGGKVDFVFEKAQDVLQSLKQKIKDGSATNKEYIQAMILVNEAAINNNSLLLKDHVPVTQTEYENKPRLFTPTSHESSFPEDCAILSTENKETLPLENKVIDFRKKESTLSSLYQSHICSSKCLRKTLLSWKGENPLQQPIQCHFQRRHAKTSSRSSALHVNYRTPCGRSLRNMEEVFHYLLETECNFLCTDNFSFNTYVQLTRNYPKQEEVVSDLDISGGVESVPISFCNEIDSRKLPQFKYRKTIWPRMCYLNSLSSRLPDSCDCSEGCIDIKKCACLQLTAKNARTCPLSTDGISTGYKYKRLKRLIPTGIYECNLLCKCNRHMCQNRLVQHGPQIRLQVFQSEKKGWGVRCLDDVDRGTFVCIYSGRLLSRATPESPTATDGGGREQDLMKTTLSKKRRVEVACSCCETHPGSPETDPREATMEMNYKNIPRMQHHSVIRCAKSKIAASLHNEKNMVKLQNEAWYGDPQGFVSSDSVTPEDNSGVKPAQEHLNSEARRVHEDSRSNQVEDSEDEQLMESDVIDIAKSMEDTLGESSWNQAATLGPEKNKKELEGQTQRSQEEKPPAPASQQVLEAEELPHGAPASQQVLEAEELPCGARSTPDSPRKFGKENVFLLDASKEGNVGRFLNHSCRPNLLVQKVFVETHDRDFPLMAFFTSRYVKARTELTWDYGYEAGTMPDKEIICQCGVNKCRKKII